MRHRPPADALNGIFTAAGSVNSPLPFWAKTRAPCRDRLKVALRWGMVRRTMSSPASFIE